MGYAEGQRYFSYEEYLQIEQNEGVRYEFHDGEVFAMAGGTKRHNSIAKNISKSLDTMLSEKPCQTFTSDVKLELIPQQKYVYPDVLLVCDPSDLENDLADSVSKPSLIVEVLSDSTMAYDLGAKKNWYFQIPSLKYYVLVWQNTCLVECYERKNDFWAYQSYQKITDILDLKDLKISLKLEDIYRQIVFEKI